MTKKGNGNKVIIEVPYSTLFSVGRVIKIIEWFFSTIVIGFLAFLATNIDDLMVLVLLFSLTNSNFKRRHVVIGQYLGFAVIIMVSLPGFFVKWIVPLKWIGLLGLVPIALGINEMRRLLQGQKKTYEEKVMYDTSPFFLRMVFEPLLSPQLCSVVAMTVGNGADNVATYIPLFAAGDLMRMGILISFFLLLVGLWCYIGYTLVSFRVVADVTERLGHILLPFVFILLGILIIIKTGALVL